MFSPALLATARDRASALPAQVVRTSDERSTVARLARLVTTSPRPDRDSVVSGMERTAALTHLMAAVEHLANRAERRPGGVNDWESMRAGSGFKGRWTRRYIDLVSRADVTDVLHAGQVAAAATVMSPFGGNRVRAVADAYLAASALSLAPRHHFGGDGSDQAAILVQGLSALARAGRSQPRVVDAAIWGVAMQATLSYAVSGWVKIAGPRWRRDEALVGVMRTRTYGDPQMWALLKKYPRIGKMVGRSTLALECLFPIVYAGRGRLTVPWLAATAGMHLSIARLMGLGRFVPAFLSLYPAVTYTALPAGATAALTGGRRHDLAPVAGLTATTAAFGALALDARRRRLRTTEVRPGDERVRARSGATLTYRRRGRRDADVVVVLENGLLATRDFWAWVEEHVGDTAEVVAYDRAGYGPSVAGRGERSVDDLTGDLVDVIGATAEGRPVVVVGHSVGGYLAHRLALRHPDLVDGLVLVDPSHPHELKRSAQQKVNEETMRTTLSVSAISLGLGLGGLLEKPTWAAKLPPEAAASTVDGYRDGRMWAAAREEWRLVTEEFDTIDEVRTVPVPSVVVSAGTTVELDPVMSELHAELAGHAEGKHVVVDKATHDGLLIHRDDAFDVATEIRDVVDRVARRTEVIA